MYNMVPLFRAPQGELDSLMAPSSSATLDSAFGWCCMQAWRKFDAKSATVDLTDLIKYHIITLSSMSRWGQAAAGAGKQADEGSHECTRGAHEPGHKESHMDAQALPFPLNLRFDSHAHLLQPQPGQRQVRWLLHTVHQPHGVAEQVRRCGLLRGVGAQAAIATDSTCAGND